MTILGATGPVDASLRRPWIDWIHTSRDQAAIVRPYVKWDDQPAGLQASLDAMQRADVIARTAPTGPTYVCFDVTVQETKLDPPIAIPDPARHAIPEVPRPSAGAIAQLAQMMRDAERPVFLMGRVSRDAADWSARVALAEATNARVVTDFKTAAAFPTDHPLHAGPPSFFLSDESSAALAKADLVVAFDWVDPAGTLAQSRCAGDVVDVTLDHHLANGWSLDHMGAMPKRMHLSTLPDIAIGALLEALRTEVGRPVDARVTAPALHYDPTEAPMTMAAFAAALGEGLKGEIVSFLRLPLGWDGSFWDFRHPLDYLGYDGGAGIGSGPGMTVGAALALCDTGRLPVSVMGDGDLMMGASALWTGAKHSAPFLAVICNNRSYYNDEVHQERVARTRSRTVENKSIGQAIADPDIDIAAIARAQGVEATGPIKTPKGLVDALIAGRTVVAGGRPFLIDARVEPGYSDAMSKGMTEA